MRFELPELPFERDALEPHIGADTVHFHYEKHHQGYMDTLDKALRGNDERREDTLENIIRRTHRDEDAAVFNPAAQVYNHNLYWQSLSPASDRLPNESLSRAIDRDFGGIDAFKSRFREKALGQFGAGWAWLVFDPSTEQLRVLNTSNAMTPIVAGLEPLLTLDVWEHAYYLDYQNRRAEYVDGFLQQLVNWELAERRLLAIPEAA
jgi:Fe-Mn family superoxide dismutase